MNEDWRDRFRSTLPGFAELLDGDESDFDFSISAVRLFGGERIELQQAGVTAIVGANNVGKSTVLRELYEKLQHRPGYPEPQGIAVESLELSGAGERRDVIAWLGNHSDYVVRDTQAGFQGPQSSVEHPNQLLQSWQSPLQELGALAPFLVFYGNAQGRFGIGGAAEMRESVGDPPQHPVHYLQDSKELLNEISSVTHQVFGTKLTLDTLSRTLRLRVGELEQEAPRINDIPQEYRDAMRALPPLDDQGDGMRSLMGQLLPVVTAAYRLVIVDEPEAFLHPPQAHALGVQLGRLAVKGGVQILVATHDRSLLTGLLESGVDVSIVRLTRDDGGPRASRLDAAQLKELWTDPVLKYTNVLDGLFHRLVVVAEAEGDCAYLAAALDCPGRSENPLPHNEILFVPTGGKDGMPKVCAALGALNVPVVAAPDLDAISDVDKLRLLVESVGGSWSEELSDEWTKATTDIIAKKEPANVGHVLDAITASLDSHRDEAWSPAFKKETLAQLRTSASPWGEVKEYGLRAFKGNAAAAARLLLNSLDSIGIVLVEEGELERLAPEVTARKGPGWLQAALAQGAQCNKATQAHVDRILKSGLGKMGVPPAR